MFRCRTLRERLYWRLVGSLVLTIYGTAYLMPFLLAALRERGLLGMSIWSVLAATTAAGLVYLVQERPVPWEVALLCAAAGIYLLLIQHLDIIQERLHLLEYGTVGGLFYGALVERWEVGAAVAAVRPVWQRWPAVGAIVLATAAGWGDEIVQYFLPNRYYDLRDVVTNAESATVLVLLLAARRKLRSKDDVIGRRA